MTLYYIGGSDIRREELCRDMTDRPTAQFDFCSDRGYIVRESVSAVVAEHTDTYFDVLMAARSLRVRFLWADVEEARAYANVFGTPFHFDVSMLPGIRGEVRMPDGSPVPYVPEPDTEEV